MDYKIAPPRATKLKRLCAGRDAGVGFPAARHEHTGTIAVAYPGCVLRHSYRPTLAHTINIAFVIAPQGMLMHSPAIAQMMAWPTVQRNALCPMVQARCPTGSTTSIGRSLPAFAPPDSA